MGLFGKPSNSVADVPYKAVPGNPDPLLYTIKKHARVNSFLIVRVKYCGCTNFEGMKILVFKDATMDQLLAQRTIDPHFSDSEKFIHPVARFVPTVEGMKMAVSFCKNYK